MYGPKLMLISIILVERNVPECHCNYDYNLTKQKLIRVNFRDKYVHRLHTSICSLISVMVLAQKTKFNEKASLHKIRYQNIDALEPCC